MSRSMNAFQNVQQETSRQLTQVSIDYLTIALDTDHTAVAQTILSLIFPLCNSPNADYFNTLHVSVLPAGFHYSRLWSETMLQRAHDERDNLPKSSPAETEALREYIMGMANALCKTNEFVANHLPPCDDPDSDLLTVIRNSANKLFRLAEVAGMSPRTLEANLQCEYSGEKSDKKKGKSGKKAKSRKKQK